MAPISNETVVVFDKFAKSFGRKKVHREVSFHVNKGECLGLIGGSGAGKSVLLRSIIGLERPDSGRIQVHGEYISEMSEKEMLRIRKRVAYVFQGGALFDSMSVLDNLAYPLRAHTQLSELEIERKVIQLLSEFGLEGTESLYPANLSGGMQKRVGLARSIILGPDIVLYDEPTAGLDPYNTIRIQEMISELKKRGATGILVTHDMPTAFAVCDRIALLSEGKIKAIGTRKELEARDDNPILRFMNGEQN